ncbi:MAG TPA: hypothetical protein VID48_16015 [Solirubrobacteraceae bacterium]
MIRRTLGIISDAGRAHASAGVDELFFDEYEQSACILLRVSLATARRSAP